MVVKASLGAHGRHPALKPGQLASPEDNWALVALAQHKGKDGKEGGPRGGRVARATAQLVLHTPVMNPLAKRQALGLGPDSLREQRVYSKIFRIVSDMWVLYNIVVLTCSVAV